MIAAIPVIVFPLVGFGRSVRRRSREAQDTLAAASAYAGEAISSARTVQAFNGEAAAQARYGRAVESAYEAARAAIKARSILTAFAITMIFGSVVAVLWFGAQDVLSGTLSAGTLGQFLLYSVFAAGSLVRSRKSGVNCPRQQGPPSASANSWQNSPRSPRLPIRFPCRNRRKGLWPSRTCISPIRHGRATRASRA